MTYLAQKLDLKEAERKMVIERVRNRTYPTQFVDVALTTAFFLTRLQENDGNQNVASTFQRRSRELGSSQLLNSEHSPVFEVKSTADVTNAWKKFRQQMKDET